MKNKNDRYTSLAIIGNGFDLAHGYKTSYEDFTRAIGENFFSEYKNYLNTYCGGINEWNDFEKQVYASTASFYKQDNSDEGLDEKIIKQFNTVFLGIKERLLEYLKTETSSKLFKEIKSVKKFLDINTLGLNFNYTNIAEKYMCDIIHIHGSISEKEIILGYDLLDSFCLASYENMKWSKELCRERLAFTRYIKGKQRIDTSVSLYQELCEDYEQLQSQDQFKGFEEEDILSLKHPEFFKEYMATRGDSDIFVEKNISFDNISKVVVLGHSIKSDERYLKKILDKCPPLQQIILFSYKSEKPEDWEEKAMFFEPYCNKIQKEMY